MDKKYEELLKKIECSGYHGRLGKLFKTENRSKGKIGIFITHRVKIAQLAPRILVMDGGRIIAEGTHDLLYRNCNLYKEMYDEED